MFGMKIIKSGTFETLPKLGDIDMDSELLDEMTCIYENLEPEERATYKWFKIEELTEELLDESELVMNLNTHDACVWVAGNTFFFWEEQYS
jgi:hypothetical protein